MIVNPRASHGGSQGGILATRLYNLDVQGILARAPKGHFGRIALWTVKVFPPPFAKNVFTLTMVVSRSFR
jgi:hypothetical protein